MFKLVKDRLVRLDLILAIVRQRPESVKLRTFPGLFHDGPDLFYDIRMVRHNVLGLADIRVEVREFDRLSCSPKPNAFPRTQTNRPLFPHLPGRTRPVTS